MQEKDLERKLRLNIRAIGGECLKFESPGRAGVPDRLILLHGGRIAFVEMKAPGRTERPLQRAVQARLRALGFTVFSSVDSVEKIAEVIRWAETTEGGTENG